MIVSIGDSYAVTTNSTCTVTDANGKVLCTAFAGAQGHFTATTSEVSLSDAEATVTRTKANFS